MIFTLKKRSPEKPETSDFTREKRHFTVAGMAGLEPAECRSQSPVPYRLGDIPLIK